MKKMIKRKHKPRSAMLGALVDDGSMLLGTYCNNKFNHCEYALKEREQFLFVINGINVVVEGMTYEEILTAVV
jgi:hypothetical protein